MRTPATLHEQAARRSERAQHLSFRFSGEIPSISLHRDITPSVKRMATVLIVRGSVAAASLRIRLRISTAGKSGQAYVLPPRKSAPSRWGIRATRKTNTRFFGSQEYTTQTASR